MTDEKEIIYRVRPRIEKRFTLSTNTVERDVSGELEAAYTLREAAADAGMLRDMLGDWKAGHNGIAENGYGELESLRALIGNFGIVMDSGAHALERCAAREAATTERDQYDGIPYDEPLTEQVPDELEHPTLAECMLAEIHEYMKHYEGSDPDEAVRLIGGLFHGNENPDDGHDYPPTKGGAPF